MSTLTRFEKWMLRRTLEKLARARLLSSIFEEVYDAQSRAFYEDNHFDVSLMMVDELRTAIVHKFSALQGGQTGEGA